MKSNFCLFLSISQVKFFRAHNLKYLASFLKNSCYSEQSHSSLLSTLLNSSLKSNNPMLSQPIPPTQCLQSHAKCSVGPSNRQRLSLYLFTHPKFTQPNFQRETTMSASAKGEREQNVFHPV